MGIYTTIYGKIECNVDELNEDFNINVAWDSFKKKYDETIDICWELVDGCFVESENFRAPPEFYIHGMIFIYNNFLRPNRISVSVSTLFWNCSACGIMLSGVILVTNEYIKLVIVYYGADITITEYNYEGVRTTKKERDLEIDKLTEIIRDRNKEINNLSRRIGELETEIKYSPNHQHTS